MYEPKLKYKPETLYKSDINDLVDDLEKGGSGSGVKGHKTVKDYHKYTQMQEDAKRGRLDKLRGHSKYFQSQYESAKRSGVKEHEEHYRKLRDESLGHLMNRLDRG